MLSFICATNDINIYNQCAGTSLNIQKNKDFEIIVVDTVKQRFDSAAEALNYGAAKAKGDYLVFLHHDIVIENENFIDELYCWINKNSFGIAGVAGAVKSPKSLRFLPTSDIVANIVNGEKPYPPGIIVKNTIPCESLDECFLIIPKTIFDQRQFAVLMQTWHLYSVEYCLWAKEQNYNVLLAPLYLWHKSAGASMNSNYFDALSKLRKIYKKDIYTTMGAWPKNNLIMALKELKHRVSLKLKK